MHVDPSRLLLLRLVRETGSVTQAARHTGRTPPAVSQQLARLEDEVGAQLVVRLPQGVRLTPLGERLAEHADVLARSIDEASENVRAYLGEHRDRLRLGAFPTAGLALMPEALAALRHHRPDAELSLVDLGPAEGAVLVSERVLDLAIVAEYAEPLEHLAGIDHVHLIDDPIEVVMPGDHPKATVGELRLRDFATDAWASAGTDLPNRRQLDSAAAAEGVTPGVPFESESYAVAQAIVSAGVAVAFVPRLALTRATGTVHRSLADPGLFRRIYAAVPSDTRHSPLAPLFLRLLHDVCAELGT